MSNSLEPDGPDLGVSCFQRLSVDETSRQRVNVAASNLGHLKLTYCNTLILAVS